MASTADRTERRADALSKERIIAAAIEILDVEGRDALTFRALAARLATGAGALYWHVSNKDELLAAATNSVIARAIGAAPTHEGTDDGIRSLALRLFDAFEAHPWVGTELSREAWRSGNTRIFEAVGGRLRRLGVPEDSQFDAASALTSYLSGAATQTASRARGVPRGLDRESFLALTSERWAQLDPEEFPFVHLVAPKLATHDDRTQFVAGIDLILAGISALD